MHKTLWINCCEPSADVYAAQLIGWLKKHYPHLNIIGMGGKLSREAGLKALFKAEELSVMGLTEVISSLPRILNLLSNIKNSLKKIKPDLLLLLDAPDFNFHLAKYAFSLNIPVFYYIAPQIWAWRKNRVHFLKKYVKKIFCIFPFEEDFFKQYNLSTLYVGHPLLEEINFDAYKNVPKNKNKILLLPGSRKKEVSKLLPLFNETAKRLKEKDNNYQFSLIRAENIPLDMIYKNLSSNLNCKIVERQDRYLEMTKSYLALASSGTVTLECALLNLPTIITYKLSFLSYILGRLLVKVPAIGMPNLILKEKIFPEYIQHQATPENILKSITYLSNPQNYAFTLKQLKKIKKILGQNKASETVGKYIIKFLNKE